MMEASATDAAGGTSKDRERQRQAKNEERERGRSEHRLNPAQGYEHVTEEERHCSTSSTG